MDKYLLCCLFLLLWIVVTSDLNAMNKTLGEDFELQCGEFVEQIVTLEWKKSNRTVLFFRKNKIITSFQHEQFTNRVQLKKPESVNLGVILQNVTLEDSGIYTCEVLVNTSGDEKKIITHYIHLFVSEQSPEEKNTGQDPQEDTADEQGMTKESPVEEGATNSGGDTPDKNNYDVIAMEFWVPLIIIIVVLGPIVYRKRKLIKQQLQKLKQSNTDASVQEPLQSEPQA